MFLNEFDYDCQISSGIKTIAAIPLKPQGVVQFGSTSKIMETAQFVNQTKTMFQETVNGRYDSIGVTCSSPSLIQSFFSSSNSQPMLLDHNQPHTWSESNNPFSQCITDVRSSTFAPINESLLSESRGLESWNSFTPSSDGQVFHDLCPDFGIPDDFDISQWTPTSPDLYQDLIPISSDSKEAILMPVINESQINLNPPKSNNDVGNESTVLGPSNGLFSNLGIDELLEGISSTSHAIPSEAKRRKTENSIWAMSSLQTILHKSEPGLWIGNGHGMNHLSKDSPTKKKVEPPNATKKKAKQGTRPRPKDRQQILDRMAELRELIPNGDKMSIDCLLDRTIKHMLFLQSVTKYADRIKHADELKGNKDKDPSSNGATWAYELGNQTMVCPLIVEDLSTPGQMLIEILCEDHGFFLEMVDVIRGFGVTILKGVLEARDKIWGRFIVEAEAKRRVTRHQIFSALVQLLQVTCVDVTQAHSKVMEERNQLLDNYHQSLVQLPVNLAETNYCVNV
uniref:transcription factor LHW-like n=1 Tax=Erigeron canadensis TaxID=72917 RepID=UPI001CB9534A|nr:transcription factor LHW-like [Erigeron canadensis]